MLGVLFLSAGFLGRVHSTQPKRDEIMEGRSWNIQAPNSRCSSSPDGQNVRYSAFRRTVRPWGNGFIYPLSLVIFLAKVFVVVLMVTLIAATHARYPLTRQSVTTLACLCCR